MKIDLKKALLAGTAIVAVSAFSTQAQAQADLTLGANGTWASAGGQTSANVANASTGDNVEINADGVTLTITNDATADDGGGVNTFELGDVTDSSNAGNGAITITSGAAADPTVTINSVDVGGNVAITGDNGDNATIAVIITEDMTVGGALAVTTNEASAADNVTLDVNGDLEVTGATTLTSAAGAGAGGDITVTLAGDATFTGGVVMDDVGGGIATLTFDGTAAQDVSGAINGAVAGDGTILITNTSAGGVTFAGAVGATRLAAITVSNNGNDVSATFENTVGATAIVLGNGAGADTNTITFDSSDNDFTVTGTVNGTAGDVDDVVVNGGGTVTSAGIWGGVSPLDNLTVTGAGTELDANAAISATAVGVGTGATLDMGALLTGAVTLTGTGTLNITGGGVTGNINGAAANGGTVDVDASATITGSIGNTTTVGTLTIAEAADLAVSAAGGARTIAANSIVFEDAASDGTDATLALTLGNNVTINGAITTQIDGEGNITGSAAAGIVSFGDDVGTAAAALGAITFAADASAAGITTADDLYVDAITIGAGDVITLNGDGVPQVVSGTVNGTGAGLGAIVVGDGTVESDASFQGVIGGANTLATFDVAANAEAEILANMTTGTDITVDGTLSIGQAVVAASAAVADNNAAVDGTFEFVLGTTALGVGEAGRMNLTDVDFANFDGGAAINVIGVSIGTGIIESGEEFLVIQESGGDSDIANATAATDVEVDENIALFDFRIVTGEHADIDTETLAAEELFVIAERVATSSIVATTNNAVALDALLSVNATTDQDLLDVIANVQGGTLTEIDELAESIQPTIDGSTTTAAFNVTNSSLDLMDMRLAALRTDQETGMAAGNAGQGLRWWGQVFGKATDQGTRDTIDGYDADTWGLAAGLDTENMNDRAVIGVALSYGSTDVSSENVNSTDTEINTYQLTLYGDYDIDDRTFVNGMAAYGWHDIESTRHDLGGVIGLNAHGDYDADQFTVRGNIGRDYAFNGATLTPTAMAHWTHFNADDYTEDGAGGAGLTVDSDSVNVFEIGAGVKASWQYQNADGSEVVPELRAAYRYDLVGDQIQTTSNFIGGGNAFTVEGADPAQHTFNLGAGVTYYSTDNWELTASYDFETKADYDSHSGILRAGYKF